VVGRRSWQADRPGKLQVPAWWEVGAAGSCRQVKAWARQVEWQGGRHGGQRASYQHPDDGGVMSLWTTGPPRSQPLGLLWLANIIWAAMTHQHPLGTWHGSWSMAHLMSVHAPAWPNLCAPSSISHPGPMGPRRTCPKPFAVGGLKLCGLTCSAHVQAFCSRESEIFGAYVLSTHPKPFAAGSQRLWGLAC